MFCFPRPRHPPVRWSRPLLTPSRGTGYIGSFTVLALLQADYKVVVVDNLYNSFVEALHRVELICGKKAEFVKLDITDEAALDKVFEAHPDIDNVIHFAALKVVISLFYKFVGDWFSLKTPQRPSENPPRYPSSTTA